jgi:hypothetical protein
MRIFGRSSAFDNAFASLREALPKKAQINSKTLTQSLPSAFSALTTLKNNKENKTRLGFCVSSTSLNGINEKWKNSFSEIRVKGAFRQSSSASNKSSASDKDRRELQARASDVLGQVKQLEALADKIRRDINRNEKNPGLNERMSHDPELHAIYDGLRIEIKSAKSKIYNRYFRQHEGLLHKADPTKKDFDNMIKYFDNISLSVQSKFRFAEQKIKNLKQDLT